jgi:hypothetical protein
LGDWRRKIFKQEEEWIVLEYLIGYAAVLEKLALLN